MTLKISSPSHVLGIVRVQVHILCVGEPLFKTCEDMFHPFLQKLPSNLNQLLTLKGTGDEEERIRCFKIITPGEVFSLRRHDERILRCCAMECGCLTDFQIPIGDEHESGEDGKNPNTCCVYVRG